MSSPLWTKRDSKGAKQPYWATPDTQKAYPAFKREEVEPEPEVLSHDEQVLVEEKASLPPAAESELPPIPVQQVENLIEVSPAEPPPELALLEEQLLLVSQTLKQLFMAQNAQREASAREATEIGLGIAEELAAGAIEVDPSRVLHLAFEALDLLQDEREITVRIHPGIHAQLEGNGLLDDFGEGARMQVRADSGVGDLGCIVETKGGRVDARVRARLLKLRHLIEQGESEGDQE